ncbi:hypothetical protein Cs7R123_57310 [Catellatospora sp. TT07R-123]|uniref:hypothetical protein n=1 Tax=Catellatospora sp. TT07R-123 TaxID=2733863 RepID=UPI001B08AAB2|nr:hypothetical protein [Catellatospora sp. TT07R-123]GHJ48389.1 hypothetical protein Cs7R123_57310 [Catellatospora sp. TT07R-123]
MSTEESSGLSKTATIVTIAGTLLGTLLAYLSLAAAVKWPPFTPKPAVTVFQGGDPHDNRCPGSACHKIGVSLSDFDADTTVRCTLDSTEGPDVFGTVTVRVDGDGQGQVESTNFYGTPGGWVSATCDGHTGRLDGW